MELKDIAAKIDGISDNVKSQLEASEKSINKNVDDKIKQANDSLREDIQKSVKEAKELAEKNTEAIDEIKAKQGTLMNGPLGAVKSFFSELGEKLQEKSDKLKEYKESKKGFQIEMAAKAVGNMGSSASLTGSYFVTPTVMPGITIKLYEETHMRDLLPVGQTNSNTIRYVVDNGGEGGPTMVAEAGTKPQIDRDLEIKDSPVRKIATYFRVPEEMIEDIPYLQSFLAQIGVEEVQAVEDTQVLYGDGTGQNLSGFNTLGTSFAAGTSVVGASANEFDVIGAAKKQLRVAKIGGPLVALLSPVDYYNMRYVRKDTTNNYLFQGGGNGINLGLQVDGVQILEHTSVVANDFFVFSPRAAMIYDRAGTTVRFYDQDQDNAIKNLITIVIEKRVALCIHRPAGIIKGTISAAITDLTS